MYFKYCNLFYFIIFLFNSIPYSSSFTATSIHCAVRREISPCTCRHQGYTSSIVVVCEKMASFGQVVDALQDRFDRMHPISLKIAVSNLDDMPSKSFQELGMTISNLKLIFSNLSILHEDVFVGLKEVIDFSLSDNILPHVPSHILRLMPTIQTLDLSRNKINTISANDLKGMPSLMTLLLADNNLTHIHENTFPATLKHLHIGINNLVSLNNSLRGLTDLKWLFLNDNNISSLENQFGPLRKLILLVLNNNQLESLPSDIQHFTNLGSLFADQNRITHLNGLLSGLSNLQRINLPSNRIRMLRKDEFAELEILEELNLSNNEIVSINSSLSRLQNLVYLDMSHNNLPEFLIQDLQGLEKLRVVDLSHNKITKLGGKQENKNLVEAETILFELRLQHNYIVTLDGSLMGIHGLHRLNLSHNLLTEISPDDFIGLDELKMLDISHNALSTLEETSKTFLPALEELMASHNSLTALEKDFHGLPVLCLADLAHNNIKAINIQLALKTQCRIHGLNSTLRIYLQGNPVLCADSMRDIIEAMESQNNTKIHGEMVCPINIDQFTTTSTTIGTTKTTTQEPTTTRSTLSTITTQRSTTPENIIPIQESTETITLEIPQQIDNTNNHIPIQDRMNVEDKSEDDKSLEGSIKEGKIEIVHRQEDKIREPKLPILEINIPISMKDKISNQIPTSDPSLESSTGTSSATLKPKSNLSPLYSALEPAVVEYIVDNTTEMETQISVIKN